MVEDNIARCMAVVVVYRFEAIQVGEGDGDRRAGGAGILQGDLQEGEELAAVPDAGQFIAQAGFLQLTGAFA